MMSDQVCLSHSLLDALKLAHASKRIKKYPLRAFSSMARGSNSLLANHCPVDRAATYIITTNP